MGLFLLVVAIAGAASLRVLVPALRPRSPAELPSGEPFSFPEPLTIAEEKVRAIHFGGVPGALGKLSSCPAGTRPVNVSKMFPDGTIRSVTMCMRTGDAAAPAEFAFPTAQVGVLSPLLIDFERLSEPTELGGISIVGVK